jgi:broad specificity phosphatase PhoE
LAARAAVGSAGDNGRVADIFLIRHGQTEWSAAGRHTSRTDLPLTAEGERQARAVGARLAGHRFAAVLVSPRTRARQTAKLAGLAITAVDDDLAEWDYGDYEGTTTAEIHTRRPDWRLWRDGCPGGESPEQVGARLDRVLARARDLAAGATIGGGAGPSAGGGPGPAGGGDVALVAHGHSLRVAGARWVALPPAAGGLLALDVATLSVLGYEHGSPVLREWNGACAPG